MVPRENCCGRIVLSQAAIMTHTPTSTHSWPTPVLPAGHFTPLMLCPSVFPDNKICCLMSEVETLWKQYFLIFHCNNSSVKRQTTNFVVSWFETRDFWKSSLSLFIFIEYADSVFFCLNILFSFLNFCCKLKVFDQGILLRENNRSMDDEIFVSCDNVIDSYDSEYYFREVDNFEKMLLRFFWSVVLPPSRLRLKVFTRNISARFAYMLLKRFITF